MVNRKKILIVEDEKPLAQALRLKLGFSGYDVSVAENGQECLNMVAKQTFDIILLDMMMPVMDGFQTLQGLQKLKNKTPIFALSNLSVDDDVAKVLKMGANKYFIKSDTPLSVLVDEVKKVLT